MQNFVEVHSTSGFYSQHPQFYEYYVYNFHCNNYDLKSYCFKLKKEGSNKNMILTLKAIVLHTKLNLSMLSVESQVKDLKHNSQYKCNHFRFVELNCIKFEFHKEKTY